MGILILIIAVVFFIVIITYIKNKENKKNRPWATKEAHDRYLREKELRKIEKEKERRKLLEKAYAPHAAKDSDNEYSEITKEFLSILPSPNKYLSVLAAVHNPEGKKLHLSKLNKNQLGDITHLYIKKYDGNQTDIFDYLKVEDSEMGAWQAFLLHNISSILPTWWHAHTTAIKYILSYKEINKPEILDALINYPKSLSPNIVKYEDHYIITYCYWNDWSGLNRKKVRVLISEGKPTFENIGYETIYSYNCGIRF